jgi:hypothetical protein
VNVKQPCGVSTGFGALGYHRNDLILLIGPEFWATTSDSALLAGSIQSRLCSFRKYRSFKLVTILYYRYLSAYRPIPQSSFHSRRMPRSEWLDCRIRQILCVQRSDTLPWKTA